MDQRAVIELLANYKAILTKYIPLEKLYLYGSYAKGNWGKESDIDVAIILDEYSMDYLELRKLVWKLRSGLDLRIEPIIIELKNDKSDFLAEVMKNGIEIH